MEKNINLPKVLTSRELLTIYLVAKGYADNEIAVMMKISVHTVRAVMHSVLKKLDAKNRPNAVYKAMIAGMITDKALIAKYYE